MKRFLVITLILLIHLCVGLAFAGDYYVRSGATGSNDGSDWTNAWHDFDHISWAGKTGGDTIWIAGGTYAAQLAVGASGLADNNRLYIKRVRTTDTTPAAASGWNATYDAQVILTYNTGYGAIYLNGQSYLAIDGQVANGIKTDASADTHGNGVALDHGSTTSYVTLRYLEIAGPGVGATPTGEGRGLNLTATTGAASHYLVEYCYIHDQDAHAYLYNVSDIIFQYDEFANSGCAGGESANCHPNMVYMYNVDNLTVRNNTFSAWATEGWYCQQYCSEHDYYNNIFYGAAGAGKKGIAVDSAVDAATGIRIYNNTFYNVNQPIRFQAGKSHTGEVKNNLIHTYSLLEYVAGVTRSNNWYSGTPAYGETGEVDGGAADPFTAKATNDFTLAAESSPIGAGADLSVSFTADKNGVTRTVPWDIGAYKYNTSGTNWDVTTSKAAGNGTISASAVVADGLTTVVTGTPDNGWKSAWSGTCGGTASTVTKPNDTYTTNVIMADCTVVVTFTAITLMPW